MLIKYNWFLENRDKAVVVRLFFEHRLFIAAVCKKNHSKTRRGQTRGTMVAVATERKNKIYTDSGQRYNNDVTTNARNRGEKKMRRKKINLFHTPCNASECATFVARLLLRPGCQIRL